MVARGRLHPWHPVLSPSSTPCHTCWFCWGADHFAAVACGAVVQVSHADGRVVVAAPGPFLDELGQRLRLRAVPPDAWLPVRLEDNLNVTAFPGSLDEGRLVIVVATGVLTAAARGPGRAASAVETLERFESQAALRTQSGGAPMLCVYDVGAVAALDEESRRQLLGLALARHHAAFALGGLMASEQLLDVAGRARLAGA